MINLLPYIRGNGQMYQLEYDIAGRQGTQTLQTQYDHARGIFYQVKDSQWERLYWDNYYLYRHADTSEANDRYYVQFTGDQPGAVWSPRKMQVGQTFERNPHVIHYYKTDASIRTQGTFRSTIQLIAHHPVRSYPTGFTLQDVIELAWIVDGRVLERYEYARDHGLVAWDGGSIGHSHICARKQGPGGLQREQVPSLSPFDPATLYFNPSPCYTPKITTPGIDVSKWQGPNIDWPAVAASGIKYAFIRASCGMVQDPQYLPNLLGATAAGLHTGAYHYLHAKNPVEQAAFFYDTLTAAGDLWEPSRIRGCPDPDTHLPLPLLNVLDVEGKGKTAAGVKAFLDEFERLTGGQKPLIYTAAYIWNNLPGDTSWAADYGLWVANYTPQDQPYLPKPWKDWVFWQHTSSFDVPGIRSPVDHNRYNGSHEDLIAYLQDYWKH